MEPGDQSSARLSEINQHSSRRWVIEYSRRARYRNVMNLIRSKTARDPSPVTTVIEFATHPAVEAFTVAAVYLETVILNECGSDSSGNVNGKVLRLDFCVWMNQQRRLVFLGSVLVNAVAAVRGAEAGCGWVGHGRF